MCGCTPSASKKFPVTDGAEHALGGPVQPQVHTDDAVGDHVLEDAAVAQVAIVRVGHLVAVSRLDADDAPGVGDGGLMEQDRPERREDRGVDADAGAEREHAGQHERGASSQTAAPVADVADQVFEHARGTRLTRLFLVGLDAPELHLRAPARVLGGEPLPDQIPGAAFQMKCKLVAHLALEPRAPDPVEKTVQPKSKAPHQTSPVRADKAAAMADATRFHPSVSSRRRLRPAGVNL